MARAAHVHGAKNMKYARNKYINIFPWPWKAPQTGLNWRASSRSTEGAMDIYTYHIMLMTRKPRPARSYLVILWRFSQGDKGEWSELDEGGGVLEFRAKGLVFSNPFCLGICLDDILPCYCRGGGVVWDFYLSPWKKESWWQWQNPFPLSATKTSRTYDSLLCIPLPKPRPSHWAVVCEESAGLLSLWYQWISDKKAKLQADNNNYMASLMNNTQDRFSSTCRHRWLDRAETDKSSMCKGINQVVEEG